MLLRWVPDGVSLRNLICRPCTSHGRSRDAAVLRLHRRDLRGGRSLRAKARRSLPPPERSDVWLAIVDAFRTCLQFADSPVTRTLPAKPDIQARPRYLPISAPISARSRMR